MTRLFCILLTLLFSLSGPAMGEYSDFERSSLAANNAPQLAKQLGNTGEAAAGIARRRVQIPSATGTAKFRLPDQLAPTFLREIKNVKHQSLTNQLRDFIDFSANTNRQFILEVRPTTTFSKPLQRLIDEGKVAVVRNPNL